MENPEDKTATASDATTQVFYKEFLSATDEGGAEPDAQTASAEGNPSKEKTAPSEGQPAEASAEPAAKSSTPDADKKPIDEKDKKPEVAKVDDEQKSILDRAGLTETEPESVETLQTKFAESSKEAKRLAAELKAREKYLADMGIEIVETAEGKKLKANDKYIAELKDEELPQVFDGMTDKEKEMLVEDPGKAVTLITKKVAAAILAKRPPVSVPKEEVKPVTFEEIEDARKFLKSATLSDGRTPRFEKAEELDGLMYKILTDPKTPGWFHEGFNRDAKWAMQVLHAIAFRAITPSTAVKASDKSEPKKHPPVASDSSGTTQTLKADDKASEIAKQVATSDL